MSLFNVFSDNVSKIKSNSIHNYRHFELYNYISSYKDVPKGFQISGKKLNSHINFLYQNDPFPSENKDMRFTDSYIANFVEVVENEVDLLTNITLKQMIEYTTSKVKPKNVKDSELVKCEITAKIDPRSLKVDDMLQVEIHIPCGSNSSSLLQAFKNPLNVLIPIADCIDELEVASSKNKLSYVKAKLNVSREDSDWLFENSNHNLHDGTLRQWLSVIQKLDDYFKAFYNTVFSIPCVDGVLQQPQPIEIRGSHSYFKGYNEQQPTVRVYHDSKGV